MKKEKRKTEQKLQGQRQKYRDTVKSMTVSADIEMATLIHFIMLMYNFVMNHPLRFL